MKNRKTYTEIMKSRNTTKKKSVKASMLDIYIQMILDECIIKRKKELLENKINDAIDTGNQDLFNELAVEYKKVLRYGL